MEANLSLAVGYSQRVGEMVNDAEFAYRVEFEKHLNRLSASDDETETTRKAKLESWTAEHKRVWQNLRVMNSSLKAIRMSLMQAIRTRREEPHR